MMRAKVCLLCGAAAVFLSGLREAGAQLTAEESAILAEDPGGDFDGDGLSNEDEASVYPSPTKLNQRYSDGDALSDGKDAVPHNTAMKVRAAPEGGYAIIDLGSGYLGEMGINDRGEVLLVNGPVGELWANGVKTPITTTAGGFYGLLQDGSVYYQGETVYYPWPILPAYPIYTSPPSTTKLMLWNRSTGSTESGWSDERLSTASGGNGEGQPVLIPYIDMSYIFSGSVNEEWKAAIQKAMDELKSRGENLVGYSSQSINLLFVDDAHHKMYLARYNGWVGSAFDDVYASAAVLDGYQTFAPPNAYIQSRTDGDVTYYTGKILHSLDSNSQGFFAGSMGPGSPGQAALSEGGYATSPGQLQPMSQSGGFTSVSEKITSEGPYLLESLRMRSYDNGAFPSVDIPYGGGGLRGISSSLVIPMGARVFRNSQIRRFDKLIDDTSWSNFDIRMVSPNTNLLLGDATKGGVRHRVLLVPVGLVDSKDAALDNGNDVMVQPKKDDDDKSPRSIAWIDPHGSLDEKDPEMPWLVLRVWGAEQMGLKIKWKLKVEYERANGRDLEEDKIAIPKTGDWVTETLDGAIEIYDNADWKKQLEDNGFFGGNAEFTFQLLKGDGSALGEETTWKFRIAGKNPDNTKARDYLAVSQPDLWFAYAICKHETAEYRFGGTYYNQFVGNPKGKTLRYTKYNRSFDLAYGEPTWNWDFSDSKPGGFGLFQVTGWQGSGNGDIPRDVIWNWQRNMDEGATEIRRDKVPAATRYFNAVKSKYGQNTPAPPVTVTGKSRNLTGWEVSVIVRYNGVGGTDPHPELRPWLGKYTQDPWTYSGGTWYGPKPNKQNYLNKLIPEIE